MKPASFVLAAFLAAAAPAAAAPQLADLAWMAGCWAFERDGKRYEELWLPPAGGAAMGMARTVRGERTPNHEFTRIVQDAEGIAFVAQPAGQPPARFPLKQLDARRAVFENPAHDFPTRVIYAAPGPDRLDGRVEGTSDGKPLAFDYPYRRVPCPGQ